MFIVNTDIMSTRFQRKTSHQHLSIHVGPKMAQLVGTLVTNPGDLSSILKNPSVEGKNQLPGDVL